jgi:hypothetical protein
MINGQEDRALKRTQPIEKEGFAVKGFAVRRKIA